MIEIEDVYDIVDDMEEELESAEEYVHRAIRCARNDQKNKLIAMAKEELHHYTELEDMLKTHMGLMEGDLKAFVAKKHERLLKEYSEIHYLIAKAMNDT